MNKGQKGYSHIQGSAQQTGKTPKGHRPTNPFAYGFAGFPHDKKLSNPLKVEINENPDMGIFAPKTELRLYSDSIGLGSNATALNGYMQRISAAYPQFTSVTNNSENGRGMWRACQQIQTGSWTSGPDNLALIVVNAWLNDVADSGQDNPIWYKTFNKIKNCLFAMMLKPLIAAGTASGSVSITRAGGTFNSYFANTVGGLYVQGTGLPGADRASFCTAGTGATWTWTATFKHFFIQFIGAQGITYTIGEADIEVDGVVVGHYSGNGQYDLMTDGVYDNGRGVVCMAWWDFPNTSHTVVVRQTAGTGAMAIDFFATITDNMRICPAFLLMEAPYCTRQGYYGNPPSGLRGDRQSSNQISRMAREMILFFRRRGYNYGFVETNKFYSLANVDSDGVHPKDRGHSQLLQAFLNGVKSYNRFQQTI
jgi:hypothetical protein